MERGSLPQQCQQAEGEFGVYDHHVFKTSSLQQFEAWGGKIVFVSLVFVLCFSTITYKYTPFIYMLYIKIYMSMYGEICYIYIIIRDLVLLHI